MEGKDPRDPYRERAESWRESNYQNYGGQNRSERRPYGESESSPRSYENRDSWDSEGVQAMNESGRQYETGGGYGYGRQGYTAGQSGQGYYGARSTGTPTGVGYSGGQYARGGEDYGYGGQGSYSGQRPSEGTGVGYAGRERTSRYGGQYAGLGPRNYVRSDERIREDVCRALTEDWSVDASNVDVTVSNREVTLKGTVPSRDQRRRAEDCAEQVPGVSHVQNNMRVAGIEGWGATSDMRSDVARDETDSLISSDKVEGTAVYGSDQRKIGSIESVMLTKSGGKVAYAVLSFGGFLGLGTEHYPLPWSMLKYHTDLGGYMVNLTKDELEAAPKYGENDSWDWTDPATSRRIDQYYNPYLF